MTLSPLPSPIMSVRARISSRVPGKALRALACASVLAASWSTAQAGPVPWTEAPYSYYADNASMAQVLGDFASSFSLSLELSPQVTGKVQGKFNSASPTEFIDRLASVYGLTWFTHAGTLHVGRTTEVTTRSISAGGGNIATVRQALVSLGVLDARFGWGELPEQGIALVSGPAPYVALIERTMAQLPMMAGGQQVAVFRLKHASVDDRTILYRDRQITTPGLAQVLRNLIGGQSGGSGVNNALISSVAPGQGQGLPGLFSAANTVGLSFDPYSSGLPNGPFASANGTANATGTQGGANAAQKTASAAGAGLRRLAPSIQADSRLNAIIVQDTAERMPLYKSLIEQLDIPSPLIEIEAMIIDINSSRLDELGIAWTARRGGSVAGFGSMATKGDGNDLVLGALSRGASIDPASLVVSSGNFLINRIRALEGTGEASIQSRPSILTIDNIGALLDLSETFYVRSIGERVATITPITAGTTLRVTPHYVQRADGPVIQLDVDIEDGQIQDTQIDTLPTVRRSVVSTQAIVGEGQTLLIGGYKSTQSTRDVNKVPGLGSIPVLGMLFSNKVQNQASRERLFMIKPRLVTLPTGVASDINALRAPVEAPAAMPVSSPALAPVVAPVVAQTPAAPYSPAGSVVDHAGTAADAAAAVAAPTPWAAPQEPWKEARPPQPLAAAPAQAFPTAIGSEVLAAPLPVQTAARPEMAAEMPAEPAQEAQPLPAPAAAQVESAVKAWAAAWQSQDMQRYLDAYSERFEPANGASLAQWKSARRARIVGKNSIEISLHNLQVSVAGDRATASFSQNYQAGSLNSTTQKSLSMRNEQGSWRIVRESTDG